jgi:hypothetical protein
MKDDPNRACSSLAPAIVSIAVDPYMGASFGRALAHPSLRRSPLS